jgi:sugar (pentulose or hexulose) kinase
MSVVLGIDLGTTTITAVALEARRGELLACCTAPNRAEVTAPADKARGRSEWDVTAIAAQARACLRAAGEQLGGRRRDLAGLGITGQQHGVVVVADDLRPLTPLINWQDRRGDEPMPSGGHTYTQRARELAGPDAPRRTGCRLATGYMGVTLFWLKQHRLLPAAGTACFVMDYLGADLTAGNPVTDPTCAASSGLFDVARDEWDLPVLDALGIAPAQLPEVRRSGEPLGGLGEVAAEETGLPPGLPVFVGIGDNQASYLGSVARRDDTLLVNVGTGGQVTAFSESFVYDQELETRPFPRGGYLLVAAGLSGGAAYAVLERFFRAVGAEVLGAAADEPLYPAMNRLAAGVPPGADGLRCEPFFAGTRERPELRASWTGISAENLTPGHLARALLEGMARTFASGQGLIGRVLGRRWPALVGAGNGVRANPLLARLIAEELRLPLRVAAQPEEAACGAARLAAVGAGIFPDLAAACSTIQYAEVPAPS